MTNESDVLRGVKALQLLRDREIEAAPDNLFATVIRNIDRTAPPESNNDRFWLGTLVGGALAAAAFAMALTFGWIESQNDQISEASEFVIALNEPRNMDLAIESDRPLTAARISVMLSGGISLDGYGDQRELSWTSDLQAGVNRLSLPLIARKLGGGQMIVRLSHPDSEQIFVIKLKTNA